MADLIVIAFDTEGDAQAAYDTVQALQGDLIVDLAGIALVTVDSGGKTHVSTPNSGALVAGGAASGGFFGILIGLLFFVPVAGMLVGGLLGALFGALDRTGLNSEFRAQVKDAVKAGESTVIIYATKITEDKFAAALEPFGGRVLKTSLSVADEKVLAEDLV